MRHCEDFFSHIFDVYALMFIIINLLENIETYCFKLYSEVNNNVRNMETFFGL